MSHQGWLRAPCGPQSMGGLPSGRPQLPLRGPESQPPQTSAGVRPWGRQGLGGEKESVSGTGEKFFWLEGGEHEEIAGIGEGPRSLVKGFRT